MFPSLLLCSIRHGSSRKKKNPNNLEVEAKDLEFWYSVQFNRDRSNNNKQPNLSLRSEDKTNANRNGVFKVKKKGEMATRVSNFSDLIQRVTASCLLHPLANVRQGTEIVAAEDSEQDYDYNSTKEEEEEEGERKARAVDNKVTAERQVVSIKKAMELEMMMNEVFDAVLAMKRAYVNLQEAHCPWDPERMRFADVAMVGELRKITVLRERFKRKSVGPSVVGGGLVREVAAPYEVAVEELRREVKAREVEVENLKEKLKIVANINNISKTGRSQSKRKVSCSSQAARVAVAPSPDLFEATMSQVKESSKSFTSLLLSLMLAAHWDIAAAVRSIEAATVNGSGTKINTTNSIISTHYAKYALESYISRKIFQGFDHENFFMDGCLSSLLNPDQFCLDCFTQYRDMQAMNPVELLGILPTCHFGKFCSKKYLAIIHPKMEESLFGDLEQHHQVLAGKHPRSKFYAEFLGLAKAVWLLHLLAFSLDPAPCQFEANRGEEFHPQYMESVIKFSGGRLPAGQFVCFPVSPGFKLGNGSIIKARVYLLPKA